MTRCGSHVYYFLLLALEPAGHPLAHPPPPPLHGAAFVHDIYAAIILSRKSVGPFLITTQYGIECWCGTSDKAADYERHGEGNCHMSCPGDEGVACGTMPVVACC